MAVVIRLTRMGSKRKPHHKIVVIDQRMPRDGRFIEEIGYYDPSKQPALVEVDAERATYWLGVGARPSPTVQSILKSKNVSVKPKQKTRSK